MKQNVRDVIVRQQVDRILPPLGFWSKVAVMLGFGVLAWILVLIFLGGLVFWMDAIAGLGL